MSEQVLGSEIEFRIEQERTIEAPAAEVFSALLLQLTSESVGKDGSPLPMMLEEFPGGRWFRDLGDNNGHFWGHVQAIKRPTLLELTGPLWMSQGACNNVQYRLAESGGVTTLSLVHSCLGNIPEEVRELVASGWAGYFDRIAAKFGR